MRLKWNLNQNELQNADFQIKMQLNYKCGIDLKKEHKEQKLDELKT